MSEKIKAIAVPTNLQELDEAVRAFKSSDLSGDELFSHWQAIRDAALEQFTSESDGIPGTDSY